ncbi:MAG: hypothetical protein ACRC92_02550 [Peptostreptococcaceae bacterium]
MKNKLFNFKKMKFKSLLLISALILIISLTLEYKGLLKPSFETVSYGSAILLGGIWLIMNYIYAYKRSFRWALKSNKFENYINNLELEEEDQIELKDYILDYILDLENQGISQTDAIKKAISEFNIKKINIWEDNIYLISLAVILGIITIVITLFPSSNLYLEVLRNTTFTYGIALIFTFFIYVVLDFILKRNELK